MKMNEFFLAQLEREAPGTRRALERVPEGGQLTVYLRLLGAPVPAIYGPSADDARFE